MAVKDRLNKLERTLDEPNKTVFFWRDGDYLTPEQKAKAAEAKARGDEVMIFGWNR